MAETKFGKYIIDNTSTVSDHHPPDGSHGIPVLKVDDTVLKEAFYFECAWFPGNVPEDKPPRPHRHNVDEFIGFFGSNPNDPHNLGAQVELMIGDETHIITRTSLIFIPKGVWHTPRHPTNVTSPIFCVSTSPAPSYEMFFE
jgi:hypothetical protein